MTLGNPLDTIEETITRKGDLTDSKRRNHMTQHLTTEALRKDFLAVFGQEADQTFFHQVVSTWLANTQTTNGGHVFPAAISLGTYGQLASVTTKFYVSTQPTLRDKGIIEVPLADLKFEKSTTGPTIQKGSPFLARSWACDWQRVWFLCLWEYPKWCWFVFISVLGTIDRGRGRASLFDLKLDRLDLVKIGKQTENNFIGVNSGIMDQFAIGMGADQRAIYLDTNTLEYDLVPLDLKDNVVVIMNTNKRRELADSKYNERRAECEKAVEELQDALDIQTLGELDEWAFDQYSYLIKDENRLKRARHAVLENQRTLKAQAALKQEIWKDLVVWWMLLTFLLSMIMK